MVDIKIKYKSYTDRILAFKALGYAITIRKALEPLEKEIKEEGATLTLFFSLQETHLEVDSTGRLHAKIIEQIKAI